MLGGELRGGSHEEIADGSGATIPARVEANSTELPGNKVAAYVACIGRTNVPVINRCVVVDLL